MTSRLPPDGLVPALAQQGDRRGQRREDQRAPRRPGHQVAVPFTWLGMVLAISFVETPLRFRAPGITVPLGLGIGRLVFRALAVVELVLAVALTAALVLANGHGAAARRPLPPQRAATPHRSRRRGEHDRHCPAP